MNDNDFNSLINELKKASKECLDAKMSLHVLGNKYASLCIQILVEGRQIPQLINNRIEKRKQEIGRDPVHPDFWSPDMIIALAEHFETLEVAIGST